MSIVIKTKMGIKDDYKKIRKCDYYEDIILEIINDSKIVFPSKYRHIKPEEQYDGQPDYIDVNEINNFFDAKLLFSEELCKALSKEDFIRFASNINKYFYVDSKFERLNEPYDMPIYSEMKKNIEKLTGNEKGILFLPFPATEKHSSSMIMSFVYDIFDVCFSHINTEHEVYLICLNDYKEVVLRRLGNYSALEYLPNIYFENLITVDIVGFTSD